MSQDELEQKLIDMTRELRDLKTAHERGLGTTRFYRYTLTVAVQAYDITDFIARVADDEPQTPVIVAMIRSEEPTQGTTLYASFSNAYNLVHHPDDTYTITPKQNGSYTFEAYTPTAGDLTIDVISSSQLKEFHKI